MQSPFEPTGDPRYFYQSRQHVEALARLEYLISEKTMQLGMLTGEVGCGKSMVRQMLVSKLKENGFYFVQFENSGFDFNDHLRKLLGKFGLEEHIADIQNIYELYELTAHCIAQLEEIYQRHLVLLFDEAQDLNEDVLCKIKMLTNLNERGKGALTVILIGQPELRDLIARVPAVDQRISLRYHLKPMTLDDVEPYLRQRLFAAGYSPENHFTAAACEHIFHASRGIPREINKLARLSIEVAYNRRSKSVGKDEIALVIEDLRRHQNMPAFVPHGI